LSAKALEHQRQGVTALNAFLTVEDAVITRPDHGRLKWNGFYDGRLSRRVDPQGWRRNRKCGRRSEGAEGHDSQRNTLLAGQINHAKDGRKSNNCG
jgi:hypothetical protein